ncbi:MAG: YceI family protein [Pseudomonadota bacterium]
MNSLTSKFTPTFPFVSTNVTRTGPATAMVTGDLTIKGITRSVVLNAELNFLGDHPTKGHRAAGFHASTTVLRSDFELGAFGPLISDEVKITIATELAAAS